MRKRSPVNFTDPNFIPTSSAELMVQRETKNLFCKSCSGTWFEQVVVQQYLSNHNVILGQVVPTSSDIGFYVLRCIKCNEIHEPNVQIGTRDSMRKSYDNFLDSMEKPLPKEGEPV